MSKITDNLLKVFIAVFMLVSPLFFFLDCTKSPFLIQNFILVFSSFAALFVILFQLYKKDEPYFFLSKADIIFLFFLSVALLSLGVNIVTAENPLVFLNEFWRRGHILITGIFCGYCFMRFVFNREYNQEQKETKLTEQDNYKTGLLLLGWGLLWVPFGYLRLKGFGTIYGALMWLGGIWICLKFLKKINAKNILDILLAVCALASVYGICQNLGLEFIWDIEIGKYFGSRSISTFGNPNFLSSFILLALPLGIVYFLSAKTKLAKFYYFLLCSVYFICLSITQTRSSWLGLVCSFAVLFASGTFRKFIFNNKKSLFILSICFFVLFFFWPSHQGEGYKSAVLQRTKEESLLKPQKFTLAVAKEDINQSYHQRLLMWACGWENIKQKPLLGWGWGAWQLAFAPQQGKFLKKYPALIGLKTQANAAHNIIIETAMQCGIIGLFLFFAFLGITLIDFRKYYKKEKQADKKLFYLAVLASCVGFLVDNLLNITLTLPVLSFMFYLNWGILASLEVNKNLLNKSKLVLFLTVIGFLFVALSYKSFNTFLSAAYSFKAYKATGAGDLQKAKGLFEKAYNLSVEHIEENFDFLKVLLRLKEVKQADILMNEMLLYYPYYYEFYFARAALEGDKQDLNAAMSDVKKSLDLFPFFDRSLELLFSFISRNKVLRTVENAQYIESLPLLPYYQNAANILVSQIYLENGAYEKAREILVKELARNNYDENIQKELAQVNKKIGIKDDLVLKNAKDLTALRKQISEAKEISPVLLDKAKKAAQSGDVEGQMLLAQSYFKQKKYQESRTILEKLYKTNRDFLPLSFALVSLEVACANKEAAKGYLQKILLVDPSNQLALQRLKELE